MNHIIEYTSQQFKKYSPFHLLQVSDIQNVLMQSKIIFCNKDKVIFNINGSLHDCFYLTISGSIHLSIISESEENIIQKCNEGHIFGLRPFFDQSNYKLKAKAREDSIVCAIPIAVFKPFIDNNKEVSSFLLKNFNIDYRNKIDTVSEIVSNDVQPVTTIIEQTEFQFAQDFKYNKTPLMVNSHQTAKEVAYLMAALNSEVALVSKADIIIGWISEQDFSRKIATGKFELSTVIETIITEQIVYVSENISLVEAQLEMIRNNVKYLCVTQNGNSNSKICGYITPQDIILAQANNPGTLLTEIEKSTQIIDLVLIRKKLSDIIFSSIQKKIPINHISAIASEINYSIISKIISLSIQELGSPPTEFSFFATGSLGRKEQLLLTDIDCFMVYHDVASDLVRNVESYFYQLSKKLIEAFQTIGFSVCSDSHSVNNKNLILSKSNCINKFQAWILSPVAPNNNISGIFFDYELVYGDKQIEDEITTSIFKFLEKNELFLDYLGNDSLRKESPITFFKKFAIEEEGENKDKFDIKNKALLPLIDAARLLTIGYNISGINNTQLRFKQLAINDKDNSETYLEAADAFVTLSEFRALEGLKNDSNGQFINLDELSKSDKESMKQAFLPYEDLVDIIKRKFKLTQFS